MGKGRHAPDNSGGRDLRAPTGAGIKYSPSGSAATAPLPRMTWSDRMARAGETPALPVGRPNFILDHHGSAALIPLPMKAAPLRDRSRPGLCHPTAVGGPGTPITMPASGTVSRHAQAHIMSLFARKCQLFRNSIVALAVCSGIDAA
jgi:hypothetical protein